MRVLRVIAVLAAALLGLGAALIPEVDATGDPPTSTTTTSTTTTSPSPTTSTTTTTAPSVTPTTTVAPVHTATTPTLTVTPSTGLLQGQAVKLKGVGFTPLATIGFAQCQAGATTTAGCDLSTSGYQAADGTGAFTVPTFFVRRKIVTSTGTVNCVSGPGACQIGAANVANLSEGAISPISFDPTAVPPPPTLTVTPNSGLLDGQPVTVAGQHFTPGAFIGFAPCRSGATGPSDCDTTHPGFTSADGSGAFSVAFRFHRVIDVAGTTIDCSVSSACLVGAANQSDQTEAAAAPITFNPVGAAPPPAMLATPNVALADHQVISASGTGFDPNDHLELLECLASSAPLSGCNSTTFAVGSTDGAGTLAATPFTVRRLVADPNGVPIDCAAAPGTCVLVGRSFTDPQATGQTPLTFDASLPLPPSPTVTISPSGNLFDNEAITVSGQGFAPFSTVGMTECAPGGRGLTGCDLSLVHDAAAVQDAALVHDATTNSNGAFTTTFVVHRTIHTQAAGVVSCSGGGCVLGIANINNLTERALVNLNFAATDPAVAAAAVVAMPNFTG